MKVLANAVSTHYQRVLWFMIKAGQWSGDLLRMTPHIPDDKTRVLRAKLIFEECMETINALGVQIRFGIDDNEPTPWPLNDPESNEVHAHDFVDCGIDCVDIVEVVDGCCDIKVVTTGTLVAFSIADESHQEAIDNANLDKFGEGHYIREDGKLIKPANWEAPDVLGILKAQGWEESRTVEATSEKV